MTKPDTPASAHRLLILTESGTQYLVDLRASYLVRLPHPRNSDDPDRPPSVPLRRDESPLKVLEILQLEIGKPALFRVEALGDPARVAFTTRRTTTVLLILPLADPPETEPRKISTPRKTERKDPS